MTLRGFFGWRVVAAAFAIATFAWGVGFYGPSVFLHTLHKARGWPIAVISAAITVHFLFSALLVAQLPALHRRVGLATVTRTGGCLAGLGVMGWAHAQAPWQLFPAALVSGAGWALTSGAAINAMVAPWFDQRRPAALAMAFNGASFGGLLFAPLWAVLIGRCGFGHAALLVGAAMAASVWWLAEKYLRSDPATLGLVPDGGVHVGPVMRRAAVVAPALARGLAVSRERRFATLSAAFALGLFAQIGLIAHLFSLLAPSLGEAGAGAAISLVTICAVAGRTLLGWLLPADADRRIAAAANFAVQVAGSAALLASAGDSAALLLLGCALFGLGVGNMISLPPLIAQREFAPGDTARVVALVTAVNQAVFAFAPAVLGTLRDITGTSAVPIALAGAAQIAALLVVLAGRR